MMKRSILVVLLVLLSTALAACKSAIEPTVDVPPVEDAEAGSVAQPTLPLPTVTPEEQPSPLLTETVAPTPPDPQVIEFMSGDGTMLEGLYYPPAVEPAPVVVLMHQFPMDHEIEWVAVGPWLQNRGLEESVPSGGEPWSDPTWFPQMPGDLNVGVFMFTFRDCKGGCKPETLQQPDGRKKWAQDAAAAVLQASELPGADAEKIVTVGTSIGADGAVDGCLLAAEYGAECAGAFSLSPGSYLDYVYDQTVRTLTGAGVPVICLAGAGDTTSAAACASFEGDGYEAIFDPGSQHGIRLVDPALAIETLDILIAFLESVLH